MCEPVCGVCVWGAARPLAFGGKSGPWAASCAFLVLSQKYLFTTLIVEVARSLMALDSSFQRLCNRVPDSHCVSKDTWPAMSCIVE